MADCRVCLFLCLIINPAVSGPDIFGLEELKVKVEFYKSEEPVDVTAEGNDPENTSICFTPSYSASLQRKRATNGFRPGHSTTTNTCNHVRGVPDNLRHADVMRPDGIPTFYQKYTETYGIPILAPYRPPLNRAEGGMWLEGLISERTGSSRVSDDALKRACYTVRFMLADHAAIRESFYKLSGRFAIIGATEKTNDIPEFSHLDDWWNERTRGMGATVRQPVSTGAEENVLCQSQDRWHPEDIFLHECAHAIANLGASIVIPGFDQKLEQLYDHANSTGLWANTYAMTASSEYFAEGVQSFFSVNDHAIPTNGLHNDIDTHEELRNYDPQLFDLIQSVFPCNNHYLKRCESTRQSADCQDERVDCLFWASIGECDVNPGYMLIHCKASCKTCTLARQGDCSDTNTNCPGWAAIGECQANPNFMLEHCKVSCHSCQGSSLIGR